MKITDINRSILAIALPAIVSNITTPLLSLVDVAIVGHIGDAVYIGAIAVGGAIFNMLYWLFGFLRMGSSGLTAQACGAGDSLQEALVLWRGLLIAAIAGVAMIALSVPIAETMLRYMADNDATTAPARTYFLIAIWGAPAVLGTYTLSGWLLGMQNSRATMAVALVTNIVNILLSLVLVIGLGYGIEGVATGTLVAQWVGFATAAAIVWRHYHVAMPASSLLLDAKGLRQFFSINVYIFLRTVCLVAVTLWFTHAGALAGTVVLAANTLLMQLFMFFSYFMDGFAFAAEALCGKHFGAKDIDKLGRSVRAVFVWSGALALGFAGIYFVCGEWVMHLLTDDARVHACAAVYLPWAVTVPLVGVAAFVWDGVFVGITQVRSMLGSVAWGAVVFFGLWYILYPLIGNHGLWLSFLAYLLTRSLYLTIAFNHPKTR